MPSVSHSEVDSYLRCRRQHYYGYTMSLQRVGTSYSLSMGIAIHKVLETFYKTILSAGNKLKDQQAMFDTALSEARKTYTEIMAEGFEQDAKRAKLEDVLFTWYFEHEPFVRQGWRVLAVEMEFNLEYDPEIGATYPFVVDLILVDPHGKTVVVDHKSVWDFYSFADTELMPQIPKYIGGLRALNYKVDYGMFNMLRTRKIVGTKTKAAPEGTGPTLEQMLQTLDIKPNNVRVKRTFLEQIGAARDIQARKSMSPEEQDITAYRTANKLVCQSCPFKDLCSLELTGGNTKLLIATEFQVRERRIFDVVSEDAE